MAKSIKQIRATFEDVGYHQDTLRKNIDTFIKNNTVLNDKQRDTFIKNLRYATFGLGTQYRFIFKTKNRALDLKHVEHAAYWIAYQDHNPIHLGNDDIPISDLWRLLRDKLFLIYPHALEASLKISKEQTHLGPSSSGGV